MYVCGFLVAGFERYPANTVRGEDRVEELRIQGRVTIWTGCCYTRETKLLWKLEWVELGLEIPHCWDGEVTLEVPNLVKCASAPNHLRCNLLRRVDVIINSEGLEGCCCWYHCGITPKHTLWARLALNKWTFKGFYSPGWGSACCGQRRQVACKQTQVQWRCASAGWRLLKLHGHDFSPSELRVGCRPERPENTILKNVLKIFKK